MSRPQTTRADRRPSWGVASVVLLIHLVVIAGLVRAFTPEFAAEAVRTVTQAFSVDLEPPAPAPEPSRVSSASPPQQEGAAGTPGRRADPRSASVPKAPLVVKATRAPPVAGRGAADAAGASAQGAATGASGAGTGTGAGSGGSGPGGGGASAPTVKIAGEISSAKDYPRKTRELRIGSSVTIDLAIGPDGQATGCRVVQPSPDPEADAITCELARKRFRFRPARDAAGQAVPAVYRWRQRWFY